MPAGHVAIHRAASALFELRLAQRAWIDVTTPGARGHAATASASTDGTTLTAADVIVIDNIPCTTLARTLLDVAEDATRREVERALDVAEQQQILDMRAIDDVLARADGRRGAKLLRAVLAEHTVGSTLTRNDLEEAFLAICPRRRAAARRGQRVDRVPRRRRRGGRFPLARAAPDRRGRRARRRTPPQGAFNSDRRRDARLMLLGWRVVRFTWQQVTFEPAYVAATLRGLLQRVTAAPSAG